MKVTVKVEGLDKLAGELKKEAEKQIAEEVRKIKSKQKPQELGDDEEADRIGSHNDIGRIDAELEVEATPKISTTPKFSVAPKVSLGGTLRKKP
jgi:hypothetical protein